MKAWKLFCVLGMMTFLIVVSFLTQMLQLEKMETTLSKLTKNRTVTITTTTTTTTSKSSDNKNKTGLYVPGRPDRSGSAINAMFFAHSYAFTNNLTFLGACFIGKYKGKKPYGVGRVQLHKTLVKAIGLETELKFACPPANNNSNNNDNETMTPQQELPYLVIDQDTAGGTPETTMTLDWIQHIRSVSRSNLQRQQQQQTTAAPAGTAAASDVLQVVVHVRRGDAHPCFVIERYCPTLFYHKALHFYIPKLIQQYQQKQQEKKGWFPFRLTTTTNTSATESSSSLLPLPPVQVTIFSETIAVEPWDESWTTQQWGNQTYPNLNVTTNIVLDSNVIDIWKRVLTADLIILSKSNFAILPALLNSYGMVVMPPFKDLEKSPLGNPNHTETTHWHVIDPDIWQQTLERMDELKRQLNCTRKGGSKLIAEPWIRAEIKSRNKPKPTTTP